MTRSLTFTLASPVAHRDVLLSLNLEYMAWVAAGIKQTFGLAPKDSLGMELPEYVVSVIDKVCGEPPSRRSL